MEQSALKRMIVTSLLAVALDAFVPVSSNAPQEEPAGLFDKAIGLSDIQSEDSPAFQLRAAISLDSGGKIFRGSYVLSWVSEHQWREEITLPGYERIRVGGIGKYWQLRTTSYELPRIFQLTEALDFTSRLQSEEKDASAKIKKEKHNKREMNCTIIKPKNLAQQEFCFDVGSGVLDLESFPGGQSNGQSEVSAREYADFSPFGKKLFPRTIRVMEGSKALITITISDLTAISNPTEAQFTPPRDAQVWESCRLSGNPSVPGSIPPLYPENARARRVTGVVRVYGVVRNDGYLEDMKVLESPDPELSAATLEALRKWKYQPANCHGEPIRKEVFTDVIFSIREIGKVGFGTDYGLPVLQVLL